MARKGTSKSATAGPNIRGQTSIVNYSRSRVLPMEDEERESNSSKGTRNFAMFPLAQGGEIDRLLEYLQSVDGQCRVLTEATQVRVQ